MIPPQPFQYQGSKRKLAPRILACFPQQVSRLVEPFAGSAALSIAAAATGQAESFWINDFNKPLADLLAKIINEPEFVIKGYRAIWRDRESLSDNHFNIIRKRFNISQEPILLLYLIARCVKGSVRYNSTGEFNQSADKRRLGVHPETLSKNVLAVSALLKGKADVTSESYQTVLARASSGDVVYMDPPYQGVSAGRDSRYVTSLDFDEFVNELQTLNERAIPYAISYDGRTGTKTYGSPLPDSLQLSLIELDAGLSTQATLLGRRDRTVESLYLSPCLRDKLTCSPFQAYE